MAIADALLHEAQQIARHQQDRALGIEHDIRDLELKLAKKQAALDSCRLPHQRLGNFVPQLGADFHCPRCFIERI